MKRFDILFTAFLLLVVMLALCADFYLMHVDFNGNGSEYRVDINRIKRQICAFEEENHAIPESLLRVEEFAGTTYHAVVNVTAVSHEEWDKGNGQPALFDDEEYDYSVLVTGRAVYRIDYKRDTAFMKREPWLVITLLFMVFFLALFFYGLHIRQSILIPFTRFAELPGDLAKGNLVVPLKENRNRYFGKYLWGMDLLREKLEENKRRELELQKERKLLLLSLSHDIKTPLSAIKLYAKALYRNLYQDENKKREVAEGISSKIDEIEGYVSEIVKASNDDFLDFDVKLCEVYSGDVLCRIRDYYIEKMELSQIHFRIEKEENCLIMGDSDRLVEVIQNIVENAMKYGDGNEITLSAEKCGQEYIIEIENTGCMLEKRELPHIFDSFFRGSNVGKKAGSGLGLFICRKLVHLMEGEIFAEIRDGDVMCIQVVLRTVL